MPAEPWIHRKQNRRNHRSNLGAKKHAPQNSPPNAHNIISSSVSHRPTQRLLGRTDFVISDLDSFIAPPTLFTTSLRAFRRARRKDVVNNSARAKKTSSSAKRLLLNRKQFSRAARLRISFLNGRRFVTKLSARAARFVLDECSRMKRSRRFTINCSRGQSQRGSSNKHTA